MLYKNQVEILKEIKDNSLLPLGTSTGKTLISLFYYLLKHYNKKLIIITPAAKVYEGGWDREMEKATSYLKIDKPKYEVISYNKARKLKVEKAFYILDEGHYIKNPTSIRGKTILNIITKTKSPFLILTATPGSKIEEYISYFILWNISKNKTHFYNTFTIRALSYWGGYLEIKGYKNEELFKTILKEHSTSKLTVNDIVELPEVIHEFKEFKASKEYKEIYKTRIYGEEMLDTQIKLCSYLRQYCNTKDKLNYLELIIDKAKLENKNVLIFYNFNKELNDIKSKIKIDYLVNGQYKEFPLKEEFEYLKGKVTLVQIRAGGTGIELTYNTVVIYYSPTYSYQDYEQSLGRAYRIGLKEKLLIYKFNTLNTIEEDVWKALEKKEDFNEEIWKG